MTIRNTVTYTVNGAERTATIDRSKRLTYSGAERIIRKDHTGAIVTRVETAVLG